LDTCTLAPPTATTTQTTTTTTTTLERLSLLTERQGRVPEVFQLRGAGACGKKWGVVVALVVVGAGPRGKKTTLVVEQLETPGVYMIKWNDIQADHREINVICYECAKQIFERERERKREKKRERERERGQKPDNRGTN
jgi:hypothetical protein